MALLAEHVEERRRKIIDLVIETHLLGALDEGISGLARHRNPGQVALDVGREYRDAGPREALGQHLQGDGLAGAGGARHQAVAICQPQGQEFLLGALADKDRAVRIQSRHQVSLPLRRGYAPPYEATRSEPDPNI
jgi:hypothetical protein